MQVCLNDHDNQITQSFQQSTVKDYAFNDIGILIMV